MHESLRKASNFHGRIVKQYFASKSTSSGNRTKTVQAKLREHSKRCHQSTGDLTD